MIAACPGPSRVIQSTAEGGCPVKIASILWTEDSGDHIARHGVEPEEVEEACHARPFVKRGRGPKRLKMYEVYG